MNILSAIKIYQGSWSVTASRPFSAEELQNISDAYVVDSQYGNSVCLCLKSGGKGFIPLDRDSTLNVGDPVDLASAKLLTLSREGDADIYRVQA